MVKRSHGWRKIGKLTVGCWWRVHLESAAGRSVFAKKRGKLPVEFEAGAMIQQHGRNRRFISVWQCRSILTVGGLRMMSEKIRSAERIHLLYEDPDEYNRKIPGGGTGLESEKTDC